MAKINFSKLQEDIISLAKDEVDVLSSASLNLFAAKVKTLSLQCVSDYYEEVYQSESQILSGKELDRFLDLKDGYLVRMSNWTMKNELPIPSLDVSSVIDDTTSQPSSDHRQVNTYYDKIRDYNEMSIMEVILDNLHTLFIYVPKRIISSFMNQIDSASHSEHNSSDCYKISEEQIKQRVVLYIKEVTDSALRWAKDAESYSDALIHQFKNA